MFNKALIADDNFYNRDLARLALENAGFTVTEAEDGKDALHLLQTETYDLLILDLAMPKLDGIGVMAELRNMSQHRHMKIVVITAHSYMVDGVSEMADFVMYKPLDINLFVVFLNRLKVVNVAGNSG